MWMAHRSSKTPSGSFRCRSMSCRSRIATIFAVLLQSLLQNRNPIYRCSFSRSSKSAWRWLSRFSSGKTPMAIYGIQGCSAVNFTFKPWLEFGKTAVFCNCGSSSKVRLDLEYFVQKWEPDSTDVAWRDTYQPSKWRCQRYVGVPARMAEEVQPVRKQNTQLPQETLNKW